MRKCIFENEEAIFHGIYQVSQVIPPTLFIGSDNSIFSKLNESHNGGVVAEPMAVIETKDGNLYMVYLRNVKMIDSERFINMAE